MTQRDKWPFELSETVIFRDIDAMGHVNNAVYFTYMETARTTFFIDCLSLAKPSDLPVIVAEASCIYLSPLRLGETLAVRMGVSRIGRRSFDLSYQMTTGSDRLVARAKTAMVTYDYEQRKAIKIPDGLRTLLEASFISDV
jgi:acyl-CoA thioester hydrolase